MKDDITPPRWAERLLQLYCKREILEDLQGDLNEYFERNVKSKGVRKAKLIYIIDVFKFFRLYTVRKPEFINILIHWIMLGSYIKTSGRSLFRNKLFSTINIVGLAISMAVGLILISVLNDVYSYDKFHENHSRIYRLVSRYDYLGEADNNFVATSSLTAARLIEETFSGPEAVAVFKRGFEGDVSIVDKTLPLNGFFANQAFFKVFSFELLKGNPVSALREPFSVVLTETTAYKLFGDTDPMGKAVTFNENQYTVTGILKDPPAFSHIRFEILGSLSTRTALMQKDEKIERDLSWDNIWNAWTYLLLPEGTDPRSFRESFDKMSLKQDSTVKNTHIQLDLYPMDKIMAGREQFGNQMGPIMGGLQLLIFGGLAFVVILSACFNYTNLSVARSLRRTREIGVRKVIGAQRTQVLGQFIVEAILISMLALIFAMGLFFLIKPYFLSIEPSLSEILKLNLSPLLILYFIGFAVFVGLMAGFFPALFFSRINAAQVLKSMSLKFGGKLTVRKALIVFQYCVSIMFICGTIAGYKQYRHLINYDLGFSTENVINIHLQGTKAALLKKELSEMPEVKGVSESGTVMGIGNYWGTRMKYKNPEDSANIFFNKVDENYITLHDLKFLAGRNFTARTGKIEETEIIVNEAVLKRFNIAEQNPAKALDEIVRVDGKDMRIIGVVKNFQYGRANDQSNKREFVFRYSNDLDEIVNVKLQTTDILETHAKLEAIWKKIDPVHTFDGKFYSEQLEHAYAGLRATVNMAGFLAVLAICIASMGLLGMVVFTTETRIKEISIRKVMGATEVRLMYLLGKGFLAMLALAILISLPLTILFFEKIAFPKMQNHAPLSIIEMLAGISVILMLALLMIGSQAFKVSQSNPAEVLKNE